MRLATDRVALAAGGTVCLVGHPFAPIGMGEHVRCSYRALRSVAIRPAITDIYGLQEPTAEQAGEYGATRRDAAGDINIFHINGDEVQQALSHLAHHGPVTGYNIIYPAWELAQYPQQWAAELERFDEIWAPSKFIQGALESACRRPVFHMPLACEVLLTGFLSRRYFEIPESDYVFLFFFDVRSYLQRKNPEAVIAAFRRLLREHRYCNARLVLKVNGAELAPAVMDGLLDELRDIDDRITVITRPMSDNETKNLVRCCDCFVSLHRSEGFGRGMSEAMYLGKPVIGTGYSGNLEFMTDETSMLVPYELVPVGENAYPHWKNQVWAEPDVDFAVHRMGQLVREPRLGRTLGRRASLHIRTNFSYRSTGVRYRRRLDQIWASRPPAAASENRTP
jgi:glycosyltransferase involved in cell wall biosynthesis